MKTITQNEMIERINRKLAHEGQQLRKTPSNSPYRKVLGEFYTVNKRDGALIEADVPLGDLAYSLRVLADNEKVGA